MKEHIRPALVSFTLLTIATGVIYPLVVTGLAQGLFPHQANGSLIVDGGRIVGSELIGQPFDDPDVFWSRPSATSPFPDNAASSSGSNLGPTNPAWLDAVKGRVEKARAAHPGQDGPVPADMATASGSGLDPHISPAAAEYQVDRVAKARNLPAEEVRSLVRARTEGRTFGILGEPRVNVLLLNRDLEAKTAKP